MSEPYSLKLQGLAKDTAKELGVTLREGVYLGYMGPSFETRAEVRLFASWGASAVGMSTVPEVIVANHSGLKVLAISCITNMAAGILDQKLSGDHVNAAANAAGKKFASLLQAVVKKI
jgi:purine-nucleoside phosphorylase